MQEGARQPDTTQQKATRIVIAGWVCFFLGILLMSLSLLTFFIYAPLLVAAVILGVIILVKGRIAHGVTLLSVTLTLPAFMWPMLLGYQTLKGFDALTKQKVELPKKLEAKAPPSKTSLPEALPGINAGETVELQRRHRFLFTFTEWLESPTAVQGPYNQGFCTYTAQPDMKFVILKYRVQNGWTEEQSTPYLNAGKVSTNKGYRYGVWRPPGGCSERNRPPHFVRYSTPGEIERYIGTGAGYKSRLLPEESRVYSIVFEIPRDQEPLEAHIVYIDRPLLLEKISRSSNKFR